MVTPPRLGGRRPLRRQLNLHIRPLEAHEDATLPTVLTRTDCLTVLQQCFQCLIEGCILYIKQQSRHKIFSTLLSLESQMNSQNLRVTLPLQDTAKPLVDMPPRS